MENWITETGASFFIDVTEAGFHENVESAKEMLRESLPESKPEEMRSAEFIRRYCKTLRQFFNTLLGDGSSEKIFKGIPDSIRYYNRIYLSFLVFIEKQSNEATAEMTNLIDKYSPKP